MHSTGVSTSALAPKERQDAPYPYRSGASMRREPALHRSQGFTLIEVLVSLLVAILVITAALGTLQGTLRVRDWIEAHKDDRSPRDRLLDLLAADLRQVAPTSDSVPTPLRWVAKEKDTVRLEMVTFSSFVPGEALPAGLRRVTYMYRPEQQVLERSEQMLGDGDAEPVMWTVALTKELGYFNCHFCDGTRWLADWPPQGRTTSLPVAIRIDLRLRTGTARVEGTRLILLPAG